MLWHMLKCPSCFKVKCFTLYEQITFCLSTHPSMGMGCFHLLTVVNSAAVSMGVQASVCTEFLLESPLSVCPEVDTFSA